MGSCPRFRRLVLGVAIAAFVAGLATGCGRHDGDETPEAALQSFLDAMKRSDWDDKALRDAYRLLSKDARAALAKRADTTTALAGREVQPWEMLVLGRFRLRFSPAPGGGMHASIDGDHATVLVRGSGGQHARVPMVREDGHWRVALVVPPLEHPAPPPADGPQGGAAAAPKPPPTDIKPKR